MTLNEETRPVRHDFGWDYLHWFHCTRIAITLVSREGLLIDAIVPDAGAFRPMLMRAQVSSTKTMKFSPSRAQVQGGIG
jgi:hypothetical protein